MLHRLIQGTQTWVFITKWWWRWHSTTFYWTFPFGFYSTYRNLFLDLLPNQAIDKVSFDLWKRNVFREQLYIHGGYSVSLSFSSSKSYQLSSSLRVFPWSVTMNHRKLMFQTFTETNQISNCPSYCVCPTPDECNTPEVISSYPPPPPPPPAQPTPRSLFAIFIACFLFGFFLFHVGKFISSSNRSQPQAEDVDEEQFTDENRDTNMDHPIWLIANFGVQQSIINSIPICKYRKEEGLIEGTECSICLGEFCEDDNLKLLPKCNHAFHISCIDTWLGSHTSCPLCRADIEQTNNNESDHHLLPVVDQYSYNSNSMEDTHLGYSGILDCDSGNMQGRDGGICETVNQDEAEAVDVHDIETKESEHWCNLCWFGNWWYGYMQKQNLEQPLSIEDVYTLPSD